MSEVVVIRHTYAGYLKWEIVVYSTGNRWHKWNARVQEVERVVASPLKHPRPLRSGPNAYRDGDPFGARTAEGALKKALREVKSCDALRERTEALRAAIA